MNISVTCNQCGKQYDVADNLAGKLAKCRLCGETLAMPSADPPTAADPQSDSSPQAGEPSDRQFRIGAATLLLAMVVGIPLCVATFDWHDTHYLMMIAIGPIVAAYSIAGLIDPDLVRAAGRFGGHLPLRCKVISGLIGVAGLACSLLLAKLLLMP